MPLLAVTNAGPVAAAENVSRAFFWSTLYKRKQLLPFDCALLHIQYIHFFSAGLG